MSETTTVLIKDIKEKKGTNATTGKEWTRYAIETPEGFFSTFTKTVIDPARELKGKQAVVEFETKGDFKNLVSISPADEASEEPKLGTGSYVRAKENPTTQRSIMASVALQQAVATVNHTIAKDLTAKEINAKVEPLANAYFLFLLRAGRLMDDEDVPF